MLHQKEGAQSEKKTNYLERKKKKHTDKALQSFHLKREGLVQSRNQHLSEIFRMDMNISRDTLSLVSVMFMKYSLSSQLQN